VDSALAPNKIKQIDKKEYSPVKKNLSAPSPATPRTVFSIKNSHFVENPAVNSCKTALQFRFNSTIKN
jgi:hypothetical protein